MKQMDVVGLFMLDYFGILKDVELKIFLKYIG